MLLQFQAKKTITCKLISIICQPEVLIEKGEGTREESNEGNYIVDWYTQKIAGKGTLLVKI